MTMEMDIQTLATGLRSGNRRSLAKSITLVESKHPDHNVLAQELLNTVLADTGKSIRIGITGTPGVGKSTFIEAFGSHLIELGKRVAVLAVDPSSPLRGGSILGDKTRMEQLSRKPEAFIRPSPSEGALGGVAQKTRESMLLCEASGYDVILVETVGVGQSEYEVAAMVDFFLVLMQPNAGDELQGIKRGIMELADALVINKADGDNLAQAQQSCNHYQNAFHLMQQDRPWKVQVLTCSSLQQTGIVEIWKMIGEFETRMKSSGDFERKRLHQVHDWFQKLVREMLDQKLKQSPEVQQALPRIEQAIQDHRLTPYAAARELIELM